MKFKAKFKIPNMRSSGGAKMFSGTGHRMGATTSFQERVKIVNIKI